MKALVWHKKEDIRYESVPDPEIEDDRDAIIKVTSCAICGSDLHLFHNLIPAMKPGDIVGHEMKGDRIVVPFTINCDECDQCRRGNYSLCERSNRNKPVAEKLFGRATAGLFGYTHLTGGYPGGQAEYLRIPYADGTHIKVPDGFSDEQMLFLGDIFPTGWQAAVQCDIKRTDIVAIWGAGPVGQMAVRSAIILGAEKVVVIDRLPERLRMAAAAGAETINFEDESVIDRLDDLTGGKGPDKCIDAVGLEAHGVGLEAHATSHVDSLMDRAKQMTMMANDRAHVLREMIYVCRGGGVVSVPGVYSGLIDKFPIGISMNKGLTWRMGQTHVRRWTDDLTRRIEEGQIDPSFVVTHTAPLAEGPGMYRTFRNKQDGCIKVVLKP